MDDMFNILAENQIGKTTGFRKTQPTPTARISNQNSEYGKYSAVNTASVRQERFVSLMNK